MNATVRTAASEWGLPALRNVLLGALGGWAMLQLPDQTALAVETSAPVSVEAFQESSAINGILCIAACNEFFEDGQASFESEIRRLQNRAARTEEPASLLQVDPDLLEDLETEREVESRQNFRLRS